MEENSEVIVEDAALDLNKDTNNIEINEVGTKGENIAVPL